MMDVKEMATWELENMVKAMSFLGALNSPEEDLRLKEAKAELKSRKTPYMRLHKNISKKKNPLR